jgi:predicted nucleic acid-binding protein
VDSGPLVAFYSLREEHHAWAIEQFRALPPPLLTCESVITEACFLMQRNGGRATTILRAVREGIINIAFDVAGEVSALETLMERYADTPMSLADACLVRLSEDYEDCVVFTLDSDFRRYRRHGRQAIPLLAPW